MYNLSFGNQNLPNQNVSGHTCSRWGGGWNGGDDSEMGSRCGRKGGVDECYVNYWIIFLVRLTNKNTINSEQCDRNNKEIYNLIYHYQYQY